jgi:hypothetical protein
MTLNEWNRYRSGDTRLHLFPIVLWAQKESLMGEEGPSRDTNSIH